LLTWRNSTEAERVSSFTRESPRGSHRLGLDGPGVAGLDFGAIYDLGDRFALDGGIQISRTSGDSQVSAFGGLSMIVGNVLGNYGVHARRMRNQARAAKRRVSTR